MKVKRFNKIFLRFVLVVIVGALPIILRKPPIKDWLIVYTFNAVTNGIIDNIITTRNIVTYPVRLSSKFYKINIVFDFFVYPFISILYNQLTYKDKPFMIIFKLFCFVVPMFLIELWAEKKTSLIKWSKGWRWYHTFFGIFFKSLITRSLIGVVRKFAKQQRNGNEYKNEVTIEAE